MIKRKGKWFALRMEDLFGWAIDGVIQESEDTPYLILKVTNKTSGEKRTVYADPLVTPVNSLERTGNRK